MDLHRLKLNISLENARAIASTGAVDGVFGS